MRYMIVFGCVVGRSFMFIYLVCVIVIDGGSGVMVYCGRRVCFWRGRFFGVGNVYVFI